MPNPYDLIKGIETGQGIDDDMRFDLERRVEDEANLATLRAMLGHAELRDLTRIFAKAHFLLTPEQAADIGEDIEEIEHEELRNTFQGAKQNEALAIIPLPD